MDEWSSRPLDEYADEHARAMRVVMQEVGPQLRGLPKDQAERRLADALREAGMFAPPGLVRALARMAADPWGPLKHPVKSARLRREEGRLSDAESRRAQAESVYVSRCVEAVIDSASEEPIDWSYRASSTYDGMTYEIVLHRYTDELADRIKNAVAPIQVEIRRAT
jgi:hypothetical protein